MPCPSGRADLQSTLLQPTTVQWQSLRRVGPLDRLQPVTSTLLSAISTRDIQHPPSRRVRRNGFGQIGRVMETRGERGGTETV